MKKIIPLLASTGLILLMSGCVPAGDPITETFEVAVDEIKKIDIDLSTTDLVLKSDDREDVYIEFATYENGPELRVREGSTLRLEEISDLPFFLGIDRSPTLTLYLPESYEDTINVDTSSGDVDGTKLWLEDLDIDVSSGDIYLYNCNIDDLKLNLSSGDVILDDVATEFTNIKTSSGDAELINVSGEINGRSSSGGVDVEMDALSADISYSISSGDFSLQFGRTPKDAEFDLSCSSGDIDLDIELDDYDRDEDNKVRGRIGKGTYDVDVHTSSGDIEIW